MTENRFINQRYLSLGSTSEMEDTMKKAKGLLLAGLIVLGMSNAEAGIWSFVKDQAEKTLGSWKTCGDFAYKKALNLRGYLNNRENKIGSYNAQAEDYAKNILKKEGNIAVVGGLGFAAGRAVELSSIASYLTSYPALAIALYYAFLKSEGLSEKFGSWASKENMIALGTGIALNMPYAKLLACIAVIAGGVSYKFNLSEGLVQKLKDIYANMTKYDAVKYGCLTVAGLVLPFKVFLVAGILASACPNSVVQNIQGLNKAKVKALFGKATGWTTGKAKSLWTWTKGLVSRRAQVTE